MKSFLLVGLRGVGKTVLLNEVFETADSLSFQALQIEAHETKNLPALLLPKLRQVLIKLDRIEKAKENGRYAMRVLKAFAGSVSAKLGDLELSLSIGPEIGSADSGDLESDLADLFEALGKAARDKETAVVLIIDELQYLDEDELSALIMAMHRVQQRRLPIVLVGGGLPQLLGLAGRSKSYAERLFDYPRIGQLSPDDACDALAQPINSEGMSIRPEAVGQVIEQTAGYPYFLQTWGHYSWNCAKRERNHGGRRCNRDR